MVGTRDITTDFQDGIEGPLVTLALFAKFEFDSDPVLVWSGGGDKEFLSETYQGVGILGGISGIEETQEIRATSVSFSLSGVPTEVIALSLLENYQGRPVTVWFALMDNDDLSVIDDPLEVFSGRMDIMEIQENPEDAAVVIKAESDLIDLQRARQRRYTSEDQKIDFPDDKGLDFVPLIQDSEITWGSS